MYAIRSYYEYDFVVAEVVFRHSVYEETGKRRQRAECERTDGRAFSLPYDAPLPPNDCGEQGQHRDESDNSMRRRITSYNVCYTKLLR